MEHFISIVFFLFVSVFIVICIALWQNTWLLALADWPALPRLYFHWASAFELGVQTTRFVAFLVGPLNGGRSRNPPRHLRGCCCRLLGYGLFENYVFRLAAIHDQDIDELQETNCSGGPKGRRRRQSVRSEKLLERKTRPTKKWPAARPTCHPTLRRPSQPRRHLLFICVTSRRLQQVPRRRRRPCTTL